MPTNILVSIGEEYRPLQRHRRRYDDNIKRDIRGNGIQGFIWLIIGSCEHSDNHYWFVNGLEFLGQLSTLKDPVRGVHILSFAVIMSGIKSVHSRKAGVNRLKISTSGRVWLLVMRNQYPEAFHCEQSVLNRH